MAPAGRRRRIETPHLDAEQVVRRLVGAALRPDQPARGVEAVHRAVVRVRRDVQRIAGGPEGERPGVHQILRRARVAGQVREVDVDGRAARVRGVATRSARSEMLSAARDAPPGTL